MPRIELFTNANHDAALDAVADACKDAGFAIDSESKRRLKVRKGSLFLSIFLGIIVVYASAEVTVDKEDDDTVIEFEWGTTWWQGIFGPMRTKKAMTTLIDHVEDILEDEGWEVIERVDR